MRRFKVVVAYDGTNYIGWQKQNNGLGIQQVIADVIKKISNEDVEVVASGRTDAKVHAIAQVFHFDTEFYLDAQAWNKALSGFLPKDIYFKSFEEVTQDFHARFSAKGKIYVYKIKINNYDVFQKNYSCYIKYPLNTDLMIEASKIFIGSHDFSSFCANTFEIHPDQVRTIYDIKFDISDEWIIITFDGRSFLRHMVRMIVATLINVGRGKITVEEVKEMLLSCDKEACKYNAEPQGLYLKEVKY